MTIKIGVIADIHGNEMAMAKVLYRLKGEGVSMVLVLGDLIGYYYGAVKVIKQLEKWNIKVIAGNHEMLLLKYIKAQRIERQSIHDKYGSSFKELSNNEQLIEYIRNLPEQISFEFNGRKILMCHGSPWNNDTYLYPNTISVHSELFENINEDIILIGHTHYPMVFGTANKLIINPGSVGQSRLFGGVANWGILTFVGSSFTYEPRADYYDISEVIDAINQYDSHIEYLKKILTQ